VKSKSLLCSARSIARGEVLAPSELFDSPSVFPPPVRISEKAKYKKKFFDNNTSNHGTGFLIA
jgi:hypothetical protein